MQSWQYKGRRLGRATAKPNIFIHYRDVNNPISKSVLSRRNQKNIALKMSSVISESSSAHWGNNFPTFRYRVCGKSAMRSSPPLRTGNGNKFTTPSHIPRIPIKVPIRVCNREIRTLPIMRFDNGPTSIIKMRFISEMSMNLIPSQSSWLSISSSWNMVDPAIGKRQRLTSPPRKLKLMMVCPIPMLIYLIVSPAQLPTKPVPRTYIAVKNHQLINRTVISVAEIDIFYISGSRWVFSIEDGGVRLTHYLNDNPFWY